MSRVVVAMSGGVDSAVAAALLVEQGWDVVGATLQLRSCEDAVDSRSCCNANGIALAREAAGRLGFPHYVVNAVSDFEDRVLRPTWDAYDRGQTPSPCLPCNERIKMGTLLAWARRIGATHLATGHYARIVRDDLGRAWIARGRDPARDQSYFLSGLSKDQVESLVFPLSDLPKTAVRARARDLGIASAEAPDSQDACLVSAGQPFSEMLRLRFGAEARPGRVLDGEGRVLGRHEGVHLLTVGQRRGLAIATGRRIWVRSVCAESGDVIATGDPEDLLCRSFEIQDPSWIHPVESSFSCEVQVRFRTAPVPCVVEGTRVTLATPVRAVTPGQAAAFYDGDRVLGRGWIR